jgi:hypothetical protein
MNNRGEMLCAWSGPMTIAVFGIAWIFCIGWLQPPPPNLSATEIAAVFQQNTIGIRTGMLMIMLGGALYLAFAAIIMVYMLRMKGPSPALAYTQFGAGTLNVLFFIIPAQIWGATVFRPDRLVEITQFGNDLGWLMFDMVTSTTIVEWVVLGLAIMWDKSPRPVLPRWFAYFNFWSALLVLCPSFITYFKTGPFSWSGPIGWYVGVTVFSAWYFVAFVVMRNAIKESAKLNATE